MSKFAGSGGMEKNTPRSLENEFSGRNLSTSQDNPSLGDGLML